MIWGKKIKIEGPKIEKDAKKDWAFFVCFII